MKNWQIKKAIEADRLRRANQAYGTIGARLTATYAQSTQFADCRFLCCIITKKCCGCCRGKESEMWIVSSPKAYGVTFLVGLLAGFALGVHATHGAELTAAEPLAVVSAAALAAKPINKAHRRAASRRALMLRIERSGCAGPDANPALAARYHVIECNDGL
jgi:hypothetical protein